MTEATVKLDATFAALADSTRRAILARLLLGEATVMELVASFDLSQPAISKHIKVLEQAGLISRGRDAQRRPCRIEVQALAGASDWLDQYRRLWTINFQRLDSLLEELKANPTQPSALLKPSAPSKPNAARKAAKGAKK